MRRELSGLGLALSVLSPHWGWVGPWCVGGGGLIGKNWEGFWQRAFVCVNANFVVLLGSK